MGSFKFRVRKFMKLFKSLLIAPATLGLLAPMSATANELNLAEVSGYSSSEEVQSISEFNSKELAVTNSRVDGLEARLNNFEAGSFSETTTASFTVDGILGFEDDDDAAVPDNDDATLATYSFQLDLNTSFTGEDSLDIAIDAGNATLEGIDEFDRNGNGDGLAVDGVVYTFPIGDKMTAFVGDNTNGSLLFTSACVYGGPGDMLSDCGNVNAGISSGETALGASYDFGNGLTAAFGAQTEAGANAGLFTEESASDAFAMNAAYTADNYGISLTYASIENANSDETAFTALNAYYTPEGSLPSISVGYEIGDIGGAAANQDETASFMVGLTWDEVGPF